MRKLITQVLIWLFAIFEGGKKLIDITRLLTTFVWYYCSSLENNGFLKDAFVSCSKISSLNNLDNISLNI